MEYAIKISVIVPVYNNEKYLTQCIESVIDQDYTNFELLLINDGSTDQSANICDLYKEKDGRLKVFHQKNQGVSAARNLGLKHTTGDYVCFIDSDDWIDQGMFTHLVNKLSKDVDLVYFNKDAIDLYIEDKIYTKEEIRKGFLLFFIGNSDGRNPRMATVWSLVVSRTLLQDTQFELTSIAEDKIFFMELLLKADSLLTIKSYYNYRDNPSSTLNTYNPRYALDFTFTNEKVREVLERYNLYTSVIADYHVNSVVKYFYGAVKNETRNKNYIAKESYRHIEAYYRSNGLDKILTWKRVLKLSRRNPKWILLKLKFYNLLIRLLGENKR